MRRERVVLPERIADFNLKMSRSKGKLFAWQLVNSSAK